MKAGKYNGYETRGTACECEKVFEKDRHSSSTPPTLSMP